MGCHWSLNQIDNELHHISSDSVIKAATINYCGILSSPFQFYSGNHIAQLQQLSTIFQRLRPEYARSKQGQQFSWKISTLDKKFKRHRYCPFYNLNVGIQNNAFVTKKRFMQIWNQSYTKQAQIFKLTLNPHQIQQGMQFDLLAFHALLTHVYPIKTIDQATTLNVDKYLNTYRPFFQQNFLDQDKKLQLFISNLDRNSADIVFIQQAAQNLIDSLRSLQKYFVEVSNDKDTLIIAKKSLFSQLKSKQLYFQKLSSSQLELINWNGHSSIMFLDNYILISGHLSSKKNINPQNVQALKKTFALFEQKFPEFQIICGCDANSFVDKFSEKINIFPGKNIFTTIKKRTSMQTQSLKAEVQVRQSKDLLLSTLSILKGKISTISGEQATETMFLPVNEHPFDHFLVFVSLMKTP